MALFVRQDENRTEYQKKIAAELQEKSRLKNQEADLPDGVEDSAYIENTQHTTKMAWVWIVISLIIFGLVTWLILSSM